MRDIQFDAPFLFSFLYGTAAPPLGKSWQGKTIDGIILDEYTNGIDLKKSCDDGPQDHTPTDYVLLEQPPDKWANPECICETGPFVEGDDHEVIHCEKPMVDLFCPEGYFLCKVCTVCRARALFKEA